MIDSGKYCKALFERLDGKDIDVVVTIGLGTNEDEKGITFGRWDTDVDKDTLLGTSEHAHRCVHNFYESMREEQPPLSDIDRASRKKLAEMLEGLLDVLREEM